MRIRRLNTLLPVFLLSLTLTLSAAPAAAKKKDTKSEEKKEGLPTIAKKVEKLEELEGFVDLHLDREKGKVWMEVPPPGERGVALETIYLEGLATGLGSNPVGLDRGQMGEAKLLRTAAGGREGAIRAAQPGFPCAVATIRWSSGRWSSRLRRR